MTETEKAGYADLADEVRRRRQEVTAYLKVARPGLTRLASTAIICSAVAAALTTGPAIGGQTFAQSVQHALGLSQSSTVWRVLCFGAVLLSLGAAISTGLLKSSDKNAHVHAAEAAEGRLDALLVRLTFKDHVDRAPEELAKIIETIPFVKEYEAGRRRWLIAGSGGVAVILMLLFTLSLGSPPPQPSGPSGPNSSSQVTTPPSSPPTTPQSAAGVFSGRNTAATIGISIVLDAGRATAYACDGQQFEVWLTGTVDGNRVTMTGKNGASFSGDVQGQSLSGTVTTSTTQFVVVASAATAPAGVYRADIKVNGQDAVVGWAVLPDGTQLGVMNIGGRESSAPPLDTSTGTFTVNGFSYSAHRVAAAGS